jgi:hypothetical protein
MALVTESPSDLLLSLSQRHVRTKENGKDCHQARFQVHFVCNAGWDETIDTPTIVNSLISQYRHAFDEEQASYQDQNFRLKGLDETMKDPSCFSVIVTGSSHQNDKSPYVETIISAVTALCSSTDMLVCYLYVNEGKYNNAFGKGNWNEKFRGNGICRFTLQAGVLGQSIVRDKKSSLPTVTLQARPDQLAFNMFLKLGFEISQTCLPPKSLTSPPLWLLGHYVLFQQHGMFFLSDAVCV